MLKRCQFQVARKIAKFDRCVPIKRQWFRPQNDFFILTNFIFSRSVTVRSFPNFSRTFDSSIKWQNFFTAANCVRYVWTSCMYSNKKIHNYLSPYFFPSFPSSLSFFLSSLSPFYSFHIISDVDVLHYVCKHRSQKHKYIIIFFMYFNVYKCRVFLNIFY